MKIEVSAVINRPIEEVFAYVSDMTNHTRWNSELVELKKTSEGPVGVGTTYTSEIKLLGRRLEGTFEILEYEPSHKIALKTSAGPISIVSDVFTFEPVASGTKLTHVVEGETGGFFRLAEPVVVRLIQRQWETNFAVLKELLEAQAEGSA